MLAYLSVKTTAGSSLPSTSRLHRNTKNLLPEGS